MNIREFLKYTTAGELGALAGCGVPKEGETITLFAVYIAKSSEVADKYENYLDKKKIALVESMPNIISYETYRIDSILGPGVANQQNLPIEPPYQFVAKIEVTIIEDFVNAAQTPEVQAFTK